MSHKYGPSSWKRTRLVVGVGEVATINRFAAKVSVGYKINQTIYTCAHAKPRNTEL